MNPVHSSNAFNRGKRRLSSLCFTSCQKVITQLEKTKLAILAEFRKTVGAPEHLLRLALNEAEALAWQTAYPHLVFPTLAIEKAHAVAAWHARQQAKQLPTGPAR